MTTENQSADSASQDATEAAKAAAADQAASQQESQDNTTSGDAKGESQSISSNDVGDAAAVLGTAAPEGTQTPTPTPTPTAEEVAAAAAAATALAAQEATAAAAAQAAAKPAAVTAAVRKTIAVPANNTAGARTAPTQAAATTTAAKVVSTGTTVTSTAASTANDDRKLPEVVAAMAVVKAQTQSALYQVIDYAKNLHPGKRVDTKTIEQAQVNLRVSLFTILSSEDVNFKVAYQALLAIVRVHKQNCFSVTARNRGLNTVSLQALDNKNMRFLTKIVDLLVLTAGSNSVEQVKAHYDFSKMSTWCPNARIQQNLTAYYA